MCRRHSVGAVGLYHAGFWSGTYTCVDGYTLTGDSDSEVAFVTSCGHEGKMQGRASCSRMRCDAPLAVEHAHGAHSEADDRPYGDRVEHLVHRGRHLHGRLRDCVFRHAKLRLTSYSPSATSPAEEVLFLGCDVHLRQRIQLVGKKDGTTIYQVVCQNCWHF